MGGVEVWALVLMMSANREEETPEGPNIGALAIFPITGQANTPGCSQPIDIAQKTCPFSSTWSRGWMPF
jgi:hypothetical protein